MILDTRLAVYLFQIGRKLNKGEYVEALMKCPECDKEFTTWDDATEDDHIIIQQKIGDTKFYYCVVGCEGYWVVDPSTLGLPRGNWSPTWEIVRKRLEKYAVEKLGWNAQREPLEITPDMADKIQADPGLDPAYRDDMVRHIDEELISE